VKVTHVIQPSQGFNTILYLGYLKLGVTLIKYAPLVRENSSYNN